MDTDARDADADTDAEAAAAATQTLRTRRQLSREREREERSSAQLSAVRRQSCSDSCVPVRSERASLQQEHPSSGRSRLIAASVVHHGEELRGQ